MTRLSPACYLPHVAPLILLDEVVSVSGTSAHCRVRVSADGVLAPFLTPQGTLPAWFGIEIIAQAVGVWSGWHGRQRGEAAQPGMLLGARNYRCPAGDFAAESLLEVSIALLMRDEKMGSFDGAIACNGERRAGGRITTYQPGEGELSQLLQQGKIS
ncbi:3-hydroxy-fatty acyl-ACP dehydratase [Chimaeribacter californicus]|uniref:3-hydroxy-fatty acyl-ACP dehydratase n=1 Tax=Chimaeribacter californicus TaxID=2060067 RepID=A0A2N5E792_9GAMM|nr:3-hydroxy-fatty acyl-ACP dehydratase [Chimaeribacter californicus]PLR37347.1 3-hydroxy-fatty acyl-ACP dehydratase [Chimaeribacter californicus]